MSSIYGFGAEYATVTAAAGGHDLDGRPEADIPEDEYADEYMIEPGEVGVVFHANDDPYVITGTPEQVRTLLRDALDALDALGDAVTDPEHAYDHATDLRERAADAQKVNFDTWDAYHRAALRAFVLAQPGEPWRDTTATVSVPVLYDEGGVYLYGDPDEGDALPACELLHLIPARSLPEHVATFDSPTDTYRINARAAVFGPSA